LEDLKEEKDTFESKVAAMASSHASALSGLKAQLKSQEEAAKNERERARQDSEAWRVQMANLEEEVPVRVVDDAHSTAIVFRGVLRRVWSSFRLKVLQHFHVVFDFFALSFVRDCLLKLASPTLPPLSLNRWKRPAAKPERNSPRLETSPSG